MSTIRVNAIQDTAGVERFTARAWVNFNGTGTVAIRAAGNVSSITDNGVGDYTVNFTTAMADANYCYGISAEGITGLNRVGFGSDATAPTTTALRFQVFQAGGTLADTARACVAIFR